MAGKLQGKVTETITLGGGCFWCVEAVFGQIEGVIKVDSGYSGGNAEDATYDRVSTGKTGHAEVVQVTFDPDIITLEDILDIFFTAHDPTTHDRQGADVGSQYRSVIFYHTDGQKAVAERVIGELSRSGKWEDSIVTELRPFVAFYRAESYHDDYFRLNPKQPYCRVVIAPKVDKVRREFGENLKKP